MGTLFVPAKKRLSAKKHWIAFTMRPRGDVVVDAGAAEAIRDKGRSVLAIGVVGVRGDFRRGDSVRVLDRSGDEMGRGLTRFGAAEAAAMAGKSRDDGGEPDDAVLVHRDDLVVWSG